MSEDRALTADLDEALSGLVPPKPSTVGELVERLQVILSAAHDSLHAQSVGLLLLDVDGRIQVAASSAPAAATFERTQQQLGIGPGVDVLSSPTTIVVDDLVFDTRWPRLSDMARAENIRAVLSVPLVVGESIIGNLNVIRDTADRWTEHDLGAAAVYVGLIGMLLSLATQAEPGDELERVIGLVGAYPQCDAIRDRIRCHP